MKNQPIQMTDPGTQRIAEELRQSEARLRFLAESIPVQIWTALPNGALDFVTEQTASYFGKTAEQVVGDGWLDVLHPDDIERTIARWTYSLKTGEPYEVEFRLRGRNDEYRWHLARAVPFRNERGDIERWFGSNTDIDDKKRFEDALELARDAERQANLAKTRFLNMLSHELRTPLGAIGGYVDLMLLEIRGALSDAQRGDLERIKHNQAHLLKLVQDLLQLAKLEARQITVEPVPVAPREIIAAVLPVVEPMLAAKAIVCQTDGADDEAVRVYADPAKTQQILINLLGNAVKFTPHNGTITVRVTCNEPHVCLTVIDSGPGITPDKIGTIFEPFIQVGDAEQNKAGTGLGLAISRELARTMNGDLQVESPGRQGATEFLLTLPMHHA